MSLESKLNLYIYLAILIIFLTIICIAIQIMVIKKMIGFDRNVLIADKDVEEDNNPVNTKKNLTSPSVHMGDELKSTQDLSNNSNNQHIQNINPPVTKPSQTKSIISASTEMPKHEFQVNDQTNDRESTVMQAHDIRVNDQIKNKESNEMPKLETQVDDQIKNEEPAEMPKLEAQVDDQIKDKEPAEMLKLEAPVDDQIKDKEPAEIPKLETPVDDQIKNEEPAEMLKLETPVDDQIKNEEPAEMLKLETPVDDQIKNEEPAEIPKLEAQVDDQIKNEEPAEMLKLETPVDDQIKNEEPAEMPKLETPVDDQIKNEEPAEIPKLEVQLDNQIQETLKHFQENSHIDPSEKAIKEQNTPDDFQEYSHLIITPITLNMGHQNNETMLISDQQDASPSTKEVILTNNEPIDISLNQSEKIIDAPYKFSDNYANFQQNIKLDEKSNIDLGVKELSFKKILDTYQKIVDMYE